MSKQIILCLKVGWVVAALTAIFIGANVCGSTDTACAAAGNATALFMFLMTLPTSIIFLPIALGLDNSLSSNCSSDLITLWSVFAVGGFVQWFYIVPRLFDKQGMTSLNLNLEPAPVQAASPSTVPTLTIATPAAPEMVASKPPVRIRRRHNQIRPFDKSGQSPLERAISRS